MIANAIHTKWKFIVEFEDEETGEIAGTLGEAADRDECEVLVERGDGVSALARLYPADGGSRRTIRAMRGRRQHPG